MDCLPTFTRKINQMKVNTPYMDPMGKNMILKYDPQEKVMDRDEDI